MKSIIIPVYKNEANIPHLLEALVQIENELNGDVEFVFVVDGSPDQSYAILNEQLPTTKLRAQLLLLSRNFGSFSAIRMGLEHAKGNYFGVMAADLQEPPELIIESMQILETGEYDIIVGTRDARTDPFMSQLSSRLFWYMYKKIVVPEMPEGGVDIFSCNRAFRDELLRLEEYHSSLIAQIFWLGFRRKIIYYTRLKREHGTSAWTFKKKVNYMMDSVFSFTDFPIKLLTRIGFLGMFFFILAGASTFIARLMGWIEVPGYTATFLTIGFFGAMNLFGLGIVGSYTWRTYENTKHRQLSICMDKKEFNTK